MLDRGRGCEAVAARREDRTTRPRVLPAVLLLASACGVCAALYLSADYGSSLQTELEGRGRNHVAGNETAAASGISAAHRLKLKAKKEDHKARALRLQSHKLYDRSQELSRNVGVLTHKIHRITAKESGVRERIESDDAAIKRDEGKLLRAAQMRKDVAALRVQARKADQEAASAEKKLKFVRTKSATDTRHLAQQKGNLAKLLTDATKYAIEAQDTLTRSQKLKLESESNVTPGSGSEQAATEFEDANRDLARSTTLTHKALDARSKSRLGTEYVAILGSMMGRDREQRSAAKEAQRKAHRDRHQVQDKLRTIEKKERALSVPKTSFDEQTRKDDMAAKTAELKSDEQKATNRRAAAGRERRRATQLLHRSHKIQAEAQRVLELSTQEIEAEEQES